MKKYILLLLFMMTGFLQAQILQNPTFGNTTTNTLKVKTPATVTSVNFLSTIELDGSISKISPVNLGFAENSDVIHKIGDTLNYSSGFDDLLSQDEISLEIKKRKLVPESERLPIEHTTIVDWGDSLTQGAGSTGGLSYPTNLANLTNFTTINKGIGGETSTQIKDRFLLDTLNHDKSVIIWAGRNNYLSPITVKADIATMIAALGHDRYLVMGIINGDYPLEYKDATNYNVIIQLNADLKELYGEKYVPIREYLVSLHDETTQGILDFERDIVPYNVRYPGDGIHLNNYGYLKVAEFLNGRLSIMFGRKSNYIQAKDISYYTKLFSSSVSILNQSSSVQTANFDISGTGKGASFWTNKETFSNYTAFHNRFQNAGTNRFTMGLIGLETGSNVGSNLFIGGFSDANVFSNYMTIFRSGNIMIRTSGSAASDPNIKLYIDGSLRSSSVQVPTLLDPVGNYEFAIHSTAGDGLFAKFSVASMQNFVRVSPLTGFTPSTGTITGTDTVLQGIQKNAGNIALKANLASPSLTGTPTAPTATSGTNTTQLATTAFVQEAVSVASIRPYLSYVANLTQTGTNAPVPNILEDELLGSWSYITEGTYRYTLPGAIDTSKFFSPQDGILSFIPVAGTQYRITMSFPSTSIIQVQIRSEDGSTPLDDMFVNKGIEFRVYN